MTRTGALRRLSSGWLCLSGLATVLSAQGTSYQRTVGSYAVPEVVLVDQAGRPVRLDTLVVSDKVVVLDFIFATCTTICPVLSAGYASLQKRLGPRSGDVQLISITIDPEHDTPKVLRDYLKRFRAQPGWDFLTGTRADIDRVRQAFSAYVPGKMSHDPLTFIRSPKDGTWVRIRGFMSTAQFMEEARKAGLP